VTITYQKNGIEHTVKLHPAKLLVIEGSHIFMSPEATQNSSSLINLKVFIDSDSEAAVASGVPGRGGEEDEPD
jgi:uridine kinase